MEAKIHTLVQEVYLLARECNKGTQNGALLEDTLEQEGEETGRLRDKLHVEGHQAMLLHGRLAQIGQQRGEMTIDRNAGVADVMLQLEEMVLGRVAL